MSLCSVDEVVAGARGYPVEHGDVEAGPGTNEYKQLSLLPVLATPDDQNRKGNALGASKPTVRNSRASQRLLCPPPLSRG